MPAGDGTGPRGMGSMTGRGAGYCAGCGVPGYANPIPGRGMGMGWGRGAGWGSGRGRRGGWGYVPVQPGWAPVGYAPAWGAPPVPYGPYAAQPTAEEEAEALKTQAEWLREQLDAINERIAGLEQDK